MVCAPHDFPLTYFGTKAVPILKPNFDSTSPANDNRNSPKWTNKMRVISS